MTTRTDCDGPGEGESAGLPNIVPDEDTRLLVADDDAAALTQPIDGLPGNRELTGDRPYGQTGLAEAIFPRSHGLGRRDFPGNAADSPRGRV
jgi:hypothetical protein